MYKKAKLRKFTEWLSGCSDAGGHVFMTIHISIERQLNETFQADT